MTAKQIFEKSMKELEDKIGREAATRAYLVYARTTRWCLQEGHGDVSLSAMGHLFGKKISVKTVYSVDKKT